MICVSIAQQSQRLAMVDMLNAMGQCDLIELRLDRFEKSPEVRALLEACKRPAIVACRRKAEGGDWEGTEEARLALLRQAVLEKAAYVEIELDVADQIRRYGPTKRIIAYTNTRETPADLDDLYNEACGKDPDVVKLTLPARTPEEAFPILKLVAKGKLPTVAVGWGRNGLMLNILGRRYKAPWTYAALEKGMEAYPGMATIGDLEEIYDYQRIDSKTPLFAVAGTPEEQALFARVLHHGFRQLENRTRCLPLEIGDADLFKKVADAVRLEGILVDEQRREALRPLCAEVEETVRAADAVDLVVTRGEKWKGVSVLARAVSRAIERAMAARDPAAEPLAGRTLIVVGAGPSARSVAQALLQKKAIVVIADRDNDRARSVAAAFKARYVPTGQVYSTVADGIVVCPGPDGKPAIDLPRSTAREGLVGVDLCSLVEPSPLLEEIRLLGGAAIPPLEIVLRRMRTVLHALTGSRPSLAQLREPLADLDVGAFDE